MLPGAIFFLLPFLFLAAVEDLRVQRIPNWISLGGALLGLALWTRHDGFSGLSAGLLGWATGVAMLLPVYLARGMGAGDVKLMGMVGAYLGVVHGFWAAITVLIVGGVLAAVSALRQGRLREAVSGALLVLRLRLPEKRLGDGTTEQGDAIPYGVAIAAGSIGYLVLMATR